eukprot:m.4358 g.4358  ORF g.4358 m.4358 type:complete len:408 (+) comp2965_c0_seq1:83-1306(+)
MKNSLIIALCVVCLGVYMDSLLTITTPPPEKSLRDKTNCEIIMTDINDTTAKSFEDVVFVNEEWMIFSNFDRDLYFAKLGEKIAVKKYLSLVAMHTPTRKLFPLTIQGYPENVAFRSHGLDFDRETGILLVVNHALLDGHERVEVLHVESTTGTPTLTYKKSITSDEFREGGLNDVVIISTSPKLRFYTTIYLQQELQEEEGTTFVNEMVKLASFLFHLPYTHLIYCEDSICSVPKGQYYSAALNGITTSKDKSRIHVADLGRKAVVSYSVRQDGSLQYLKMAYLQNPMDNLVLDETKSTKTKDVVTVAGIFSFGRMMLVTQAYHKDGAANYRGQDPNGANPKNPIPSIASEVTMQFNEDDVVVESKISVLTTSSEGGWSVAARNPFTKEMIYGSFWEEYIFVCKEA